MGSSSASSSSSSSSSSGYNKAFTFLSKCDHNDKKFTRRIYLKRVPDISPAAYKAVKAGRILGGIFTFGLTEAGYGIYKKATSAGDGPNHYYLEMDFECSECGKSRTYTIELTGDSRKHFDCGYYNDGVVRDSKSGYWSYNEIKRIYNRMDEDYKQTTWNCQHFARNMFYKKL